MGFRASQNNGFAEMKNFILDHLGKVVLVFVIFFMVWVVDYVNDYYKKISIQYIEKCVAAKGNPAFNGKYWECMK